jgi:hypothetical protein
MARTACLYRTGQQVEIYIHDFATPGFPEKWFPAVVVEIEDKGRLWDVMTQDAEGVRRAYMVGPRGGCKRLRPASN